MESENVLHAIEVVVDRSKRKRLQEIGIEVDCTIWGLFTDWMHYRMVQNNKRIEAFRSRSYGRNTADNASQGQSVDKLMINKLWWHGPEWMRRNSESNWPNRT